MSDHQTPEKKKAMLAALEASLGVVTTALKSSGTPKATFYVWMNNDPEFKQAVMDIKDISLDFAESQLLKQIKGGSVAATIFYLKTQGRKRGYIERHEVTGADDAPPAFVVQIVNPNERTDND